MTVLIEQSPRIARSKSSRSGLHFNSERNTHGNHRRDGQGTARALRRRHDGMQARAHRKQGRSRYLDRVAAQAGSGQGRQESQPCRRRRPHRAPRKAALVEVNSETDFVAKDENFLKFADEVAKTALASDARDVEALKSVKTSYGPTVEEARQWLVTKVGENVQLRRMVITESSNTIGAYVHGGRIGVLVEMEGGNAELARGIAMHIAAMNPPYISPDHVPAEFVAKEKEIALAQMSDKDRQKPAEIQEKMLSGKIRKTLAELSLTGQPYVMDTNTPVGDVLAKEKA